MRFVQTSMQNNAVQQGQLSRGENSGGGSQRSDLTSARVSKAECLPKERAREDKGPQKLEDFTKKKYNGMAADKVRKSGAS